MMDPNIFVDKPHWQRSNEDVVHSNFLLKPVCSSSKGKILLATNVIIQESCLDYQTSQKLEEQRVLKVSYKIFLLSLSLLFSIPIYSNIYILNLISSSIHALRTSACPVRIKFASRNVVSRLILQQYTHVANKWQPVSC